MTQTMAPAWTVEQLSKLHKQHPELVDDALARLFQENSDLRWSLVVNAYLDEEISLGKAAELLDLHALELRNRFIELGIPLYLGPADLEEARAEVNALENWLADEPVE